LEDLHWADAPTVAAFDSALRTLSERPLLVTAFARPEVHEVFPAVFAERDVQPIPLAPLPRRAAERLVSAALGANPIAEKLVEQAAGNVFYLEELIRATAEGRDAPPTVVAMVQSRLLSLEPRARRVLRAASVFGETFWDGGVRTLLGEEASEDAKRWLDWLVDSELCTRRESSRLVNNTEYVFRHALVREGAYAMLTDADRKLGHRLAAEWLEHAGETAAAIVAEHYARGGDSARAVTRYLRAAEDSLERNDLAGAIERCERGIANGATGVILGALRNVQARAHQWRGETVLMERAAAEAVQLLPRNAASWADALATLAAAKQRLGHSEELAGVALQLTDMLTVDERDRASLARAGARIASLLFFAGRQVLGAKVLDVAERAAIGGGPEVQARIHQARAPRARQGGRPAEALEHLVAAEAAFRTVGDEPNTCSMLSNRGFALSELGAYREARPVIEEAMAIAERLGLAIIAANARSNLGMVQLRLGEVASAEQSERAAIVAFESRDRRQLGIAYVYLALVLLEAKSAAGAEVEARRAVELLDAAPPLRPYAGAVLACALLELNRPQEALEAAREATRFQEAGGKVEEGDALVRLTHARALFACGDRAAAAKCVVIARDRLLERAGAITNAVYRKTFLENIPEHVLTFRLAEEW
jgi:eukaryotic-like serine/threonine-protein kinase